MSDLPHHITVRAGINNLFDKAPPAIDGGLLFENGNGNTITSTYDPMGRLIFVNFTADI